MQLRLKASKAVCDWKGDPRGSYTDVGRETAASVARIRGQNLRELNSILKEGESYARKYLKSESGFARLGKSPKELTDAEVQAELVCLTKPYEVCSVSSVI